MMENLTIIMVIGIFQQHVEILILVILLGVASENCLQIGFTSSGTWNDFRNIETQPFIIEYGSMMITVVWITK
jgi:hypothetical protein